MQKMMIPAFAAVLLAISLLGSVSAQDASAILRLSVGFRTMKNTVPMSPETRKEVEALETKAKGASDDKKYDEAYKHYSHAMSLMRNQPWTPTRAMSAALQVKPEKLIFDSGDAARVTLTQLFNPDQQMPGKLSGSLELKNASAEFSKHLKTVDGLPADFSKPVVIEAAIPELADGDYQLILTLRPQAGDPIIKPIAIRIARGFTAESTALQSRAASVSAKLKGDRQSALLAELPAVEYAASMVELVNAGQMPISTNLKTALSEATATLDKIAKGQDPLATKRGDIHWAYRSAVDNTLQPYRFFIPSNYDASKKWPLVIALHGMGGDENSFFNGYDNGVIKTIAGERGYIVVCPKGRGPAAMYMGTAERDVLDVLGEMKREYSIDENRIYLMGHSMGGYGTWSVAANHPELFAAIAPFSGGGTPFIFGKVKGLVNVPWIVIHGDADPTVPVEESRKMVKMGKDLGIEIKYIEVPGGNHSNVVVPQFKAVFDWFDTHKRQTKGDIKTATNER